MQRLPFSSPLHGRSVNYKHDQLQPFVLLDAAAALPLGLVSAHGDNACSFCRQAANVMDKELLHGNSWATADVTSHGRGIERPPMLHGLAAGHAQSHEPWRLQATTQLQVAAFNGTRKTSGMSCAASLSTSQPSIHRLHKYPPERDVFEVCVVERGAEHEPQPAHHPCRPQERGGESELIGVEVEEGGGESGHAGAGRHEPQHGPSGRQGWRGGGAGTGRKTGRRGDKIRWREST